MEKIIVYRSAQEAYSDQFWLDVMGSATAYNVYCAIGYLILFVIIFLTIKWVYRSVMERLQKPKHYKDIY